LGHFVASKTPSFCSNLHGFCRSNPFASPLGEATLSPAWRGHGRGRCQAGRSQHGCLTNPFL
jgi:hypothetical protein